MRKQLLGMSALCAACLVLSAQAQSSTDPSSSPGSSPSTPSSPSSTTPGSPGYSGSQSGWTGRTSSRIGHQEIRGSQLTGAAVSGSSGSEVGTISDIIVNPASGRIDFAVLSLSAPSSTGAATSPSGTSSSTGSSSGSASSTTSGTAASSASAAGGKQVAVPWMLLRSSAGAGTSTATSATAQPSFVFTGDSGKLQSAPSFDATTSLSEPGWRNSVISYFGLGSGGAATGAAETPGGSSSSSSLPEPSSGTPK